MAIATQDGKITVHESFVRGAQVDALPAPIAMTGVIGWMRASLFAGPLNTILTILTVLLLIWIIPPILDFLFIHAVWSGADREACLPSATLPEPGACWAFVRDRFAYFIYGSYPIPERWRVDIFFVMLAVGIVWLLWLEAPRRDLGALYFFVVVPLVSYALLTGMPIIGLRNVDTSLWGGVLVTIVVSWVGIVFSLPIGILLALGRRSNMPAVKLFSVIFIEFVRGVPLITVLFMASVMLPLFVPDAYSPDKLLRALIGIAMFASAYMAEVVRAGLQAIPKGQYEGAMAVGLGYWQMMYLIILPQALKVTIPNIVNTYIGLFKDTTLVVIVGIFDFLRTVEVSRIDPKWAAPTTSATGYVFAAIFYFIFCYAMSRYAKNVEARLGKADRR
ncbi:MAG: ral L-amino acid transport system permease protein [Hyphomicrobiales bacterium]|jgi:general L-amino acid transport system permease protein|nr:ral L-amino acid transport system permease protein [Hyphomicrobiales bacterium]